LRSHEGEVVENDVRGVLEDRRGTRGAKEIGSERGWRKRGAKDMGGKTENIGNFVTEQDGVGTEC
jgi:hypothetical protein